MDKIKIVISRMGQVAPGTWVRLALLVASLINMSLKVFGAESVSVGNETVEKAVTVVIMVITALMAYWKNNSFTEAAIAADEVMQSLKK